jgi:hypothetical protein
MVFDVCRHLSASEQTIKSATASRNLFNCAARCSGLLGRSRPDLSGMNADKSRLPCAASLETGGESADVYGEVKNLQNKNRGADRPQASIFLSASVCRNLSWPNREIDKMSDESATGEERTERKRRLTRGPTELRQGRLDQPRKERFR